MAEILASRRRLNRRAPACLVVLLLIAPPPSALGQDVQGRLDRARVLMQTGRLDRAEREVSRALEESPSSPDAHRLMCDVRRLQNRREDAVAECRRAADLAPDRIEFLMDLGDLLSQREDGFPEALRAYERAAAGDPNNPRPHVSVGSLYERLGRFAEGEAEYREALQINPNIVQANAGLGAVLFNTGRLVEARTFLLRAIELRPRDLRSHIFLGLSLNHDGQFDLALQELRTAAGIDPFAANQVAGVPEQKERFQHLKDVFAAQVEAQPRDSRLHNNLGVLSYFLRDYEAAWRSLTRAQQLGYPVDQGLKEVVYSRWRGLVDHPGRQQKG